MPVVLEATAALAATLSDPLAAELLFEDIEALESIQMCGEILSLGQCKVTLNRQS
jgi:hypothetical protein